MDYNTNNTKSYMRVSFLLCSVFVLHLVVTPLTYAQGLNLIPTVKRTSASTKQNNPFRQIGEYFIIGDFSGNEILTDIEINHVITRNLHQFQRLLRTILNITTVAFTCFGILLLSFRCSSKKKKQQIPVIAISIGGHDPPQIYV